MAEFPLGPKEGTRVFDDFHSNASVATGLVGNLDWEITAVGGGASTLSYLASPNGILKMTTDGTTGHGSALHLMADKVVLAPGDGTIIRTRVRLGTQIANNLFRIGIHDSVTTTEPTKGVWIDCAAGVLSFDVAGSGGDASVNVGGVTTLTSGTTMVVDTWHDIELRLSGRNVYGGPANVRCFVDDEYAGEIKTSLLKSVDTMEFKILHWDTGNVAQVLDIDYYEVWLPRNP